MGWLNRRWLRRMRTLISAIRAGEYNLHFSTEGLRGEARLLADELNAVMVDSRDHQARLEALYGSYEAMLSQVNIALLAVNASGKVIWMNQKAINELCGFFINEISMLRTIDPFLYEVLMELIPGQQRLVSLKINGQPIQFKIAVAHYIQDGEMLRLFSIENVQQVVQQSEMEAQRKLVSVLTHEIMNSLSPIISLSYTLLQTIKNPTDVADYDSLLAIDTINRRSRGLLTFVENYRKLSKISPPQTSWTKIGEVIEGIDQLLSNDVIDYEVEDISLQLNIDRHQIEQVLINLLKNATEACEDQDTPTIKLECKADHVNRHYLISVSDNGPGVSPESVENIFTPFFTTKPNGSGIGLSLSQQIILNHGGLIKVSSTPGNTVFTIQLPLTYKI